MGTGAANSLGALVLSSERFGKLKGPHIPKSPELDVPLLQQAGRKIYKTKLVHDLGGTAPSELLLIAPQVLSRGNRESRFWARSEESKQTTPSSLSASSLSLSQPPLARSQPPQLSSATYIGVTKHHTFSTNIFFSNEPETQTKAPLLAAHRTICGNRSIHKGLPHTLSLHADRHPPFRVRCHLRLAVTTTSRPPPPSSTCSWEETGAASTPPSRPSRPRLSPPSSPPSAAAAAAAADMLWT